LRGGIAPHGRDAKLFVQRTETGNQSGRKAAGIRAATRLPQPLQHRIGQRGDLVAETALVGPSEVPVQLRQPVQAVECYLLDIGGQTCRAGQVAKGGQLLEGRSTPISAVCAADLLPLPSTRNAGTLPAVVAT
jgi:hypothetical protein